LASTKETAEKTGRPLPSKSETQNLPNRFARSQLALSSEPDFGPAEHFQISSEAMSKGIPNRKSWVLKIQQKAI
jgi:hypothetical protein